MSYGIIATPRSISKRNNYPMPIPNLLDMLLAPFEDSMDSVLASMGGFKADLRETDDSYELTADFPGFAKDEVDVKLEDDVLTISCEHKQEEEEKEDGKWLSRERSYVSATRSFQVKGADEENTKATLEDGVLTVSIPKKKTEEGKTTSIEIS